MIQVASIQTLTPRQLEVIAVIAEGNSEKQVAQLLSISQVTVHKHIINACKKTGLNNRTRLIVAWARWQTLQDIKNTPLDPSRLQ